MARKQILHSPVKKITRLIPRGRVYVTATFNNTIVTVTDEKGNAVCWSSTGKMGFDGSKKSTPYAATITVEQAIVEAKQHGMKTIELYIKGPGPGRDAALRVMRAQNMDVKMIADVTPIPHNGTKSRKQKHG